MSDEVLTLKTRLEQWVVVVDLASPFVAIGTLAVSADDYLELTGADLHDLRDSESTREIYLVKTVRHGIAVNRQRVLVRMADVVALSRLEEVDAG